MKTFLRSPLPFLILISLAPFLWLITQAELFGQTLLLANLTGFVGATLMLWQFLLGIRFVSRRFTPDFVSVIKSHIFLGTFGTILAFFHPILEMIAYGQGLVFLLVPNVATDFGRHLAMGRMAWFIFIVVWVSSALLRSKMKFRRWMYIHYLTYPMMGFIFLHAREIGTAITLFPLIHAYWLFLMGVFAVIVGVRMALFFNVGKAQYRFISKKKLANKITQYRFKPLSKKLHPEVGQFMFIKMGLLGMAHPFTVMEYDEATGELVFGIKAVGPFTKQLESVKEGTTVFLDGPYGVFTREGQNAKPKVIFAGGIGITPFVELIDRFGNEHTYLFYANRYLDDVVNRDEFQKELGENYTELISRESSVPKAVVQGRVTSELLQEKVPAQVLESADFFVCGSVGFMAGVHDLLHSLGVEQTRIHSEEFCF